MDNKEIYENEAEASKEEDKEKEVVEEIEPQEDGVDLLVKLEQKEQECQEYLDLLRRSKAEFDNFRKRTLKEKEGIYDDGFVDGIKLILPVIDNLERAVSYTGADNDTLLQGVDMVLKMFGDILVKNEIEETAAVGQQFDPDYHNAVMHIEDDNLENNVIVEVLQRGYKYKDKIIRYGMVKVAN